MTAANTTPARAYNYLSYVHPPSNPHLLQAVELLRLARGGHGGQHVGGGGGGGAHRGQVALLHTKEGAGTQR